MTRTNQPRPTDSTFDNGSRGLREDRDARVPRPGTPKTSAENPKCATGPPLARFQDQENPRLQRHELAATHRSGLVTETRHTDRYCHGSHAVGCQGVTQGRHQSQTTGYLSEVKYPREDLNGPGRELEPSASPGSTRIREGAPSGAGNGVRPPPVSTSARSADVGHVRQRAESPSRLVEATPYNPPSPNTQP